MLRIIFIALALMFAATSAKADAFDCSRPGPSVARLVCHDAGLHAADQAESDAYDSALSAALDRQSLREDERVWFQSNVLIVGWYLDHGMKADAGQLEQAYRQRADALRAITQAWRTLRRPIATAQIGTACLMLPSASDQKDCAVADSENVPGATALRYQRQRYQQQPAARAEIVFAASDTAADQWVAIAAAYNAHVDFAPPQAVDSPGGKLMMVAGAPDRPDQDGVSDLYRFGDGTLEDIDDRSWLDTLKSRLPDGLFFEPGVTADYTKMTAVATIAKSESSCCPIGGHAIISLAIEDQRVVVKDVTFEAQ